jgi:multidrug efflux pump subunit AcrB
MSEKTEEWYSAGMSKEMMTLAWLGEREDVVGVFGEMGAEFFDRTVLQTDPENVVRDYSYRIQAGSAKKPNKAMILQSLNDFGRVAVPMMQAFAQAGMFEPWNAYSYDIAKALDLPNPERYMVQPPPPQEQGPSPEEMQAQAEMQAQQQQLAMDQQKFAQDFRQDEEMHDQEMEHDRQKMKLDLEVGRQKIQLAKQQAKTRKASSSKNGSAKRSA